MVEATNPLATILRSQYEPDLPALHDYLDHYVRLKPRDQVGTEDGHTYSWSDLKCRSDAFARALAGVGVKAGDNVAMLTPPTFDFLACFLACSRVGAIWLGLNPKYTRDEMAHVIGDAQPAVLLGYSKIGHRDYTSDFQSLKVDRKVFLDHEAESDCFFDAEQGNGWQPVASDSPVLLVYTSGSSGVPKGALITHQSLIKAAQDRIRAWDHTGWRMLLNIPVNHIGGAGDISCTALVAGGMLAFMHRYDAAETLSRIERDKLTIWFQVPTQFRMALDSERAMSMDLSSLQAIIWSGAPASRQLVEELMNRFPCKLGLDYSMTESVGPISMTPLTNDIETLVKTVGWPVPGRGFGIHDHEISIQDEFMLSGYLGKERRNTFDEEGRFVTGDLGELDDMGRLCLTGRSKDMFKSGGYNVYPREVEQALEALEGVSMAAVLSTKDDLFGEVGHAFILPEKGRDLDPEWARDQLRKTLANYKIPKQVFVTFDLPLLPIGKIDKKALKATLS